jgi:hypothetical protein
LAVFYAFLADEFFFNAPITGIDLVGALIIATVTVGAAVFKLKAKQ